MANSIWQGTVQNATGDIVPGAEITVVDEDTGLPATIYSSIGGAALGNPFFANSEGFAQFYASAGTYRVTAEDTGTGQTVVFRYNRFGDSASRDVGTAIGNIPDADDLSMIGASVNYTGNNLNPSSFGGTTGSIAIAIGYAQTTTVINFFAPISGTANPVSATVAGTFTVQDLQFSTVASAVSPTLNSASGNKLAILTVSGLAGLTVDKVYYLRTDSAGSKITVNF